MSGTPGKLEFVVHGGMGGSEKRSGGLAELLDEVPGLLDNRIVPPLRVVNDVLRRGGVDAGMSGACAWEPFQIDEPAWRDLVERLTARSDRCEFVEPPASVTTLEEWHAWVMVFKHGLPESFRELDRRHTDLERAYRDARDSGNEKRAMELYEQLHEVAGKLSDLMMERRPQRPSRPGEDQG